MEQSQIEYLYFMYGRFLDPPFGDSFPNLYIFE